MEFSLIADTVAVYSAKHGIAFGNSLLNRWDLTNQSPGAIFQASAVFFPVDAIAPPSVESKSYKTIRRIRKKRRTRLVSFDGYADGGGDFVRFLFEGGSDGNNGPFGFGGSGNDGGGKGRNSGGGGFGRENWDESSSWSDPAMEFVYEVICWIALSNCVHFAFKRIVRILTDGERS